MKFLLLIYTDDTLLEALPAGAFDQMMHGCITHADELKTQGTLLESQQLEHGSTARTVRVRDGKTQVVDGPFAETKEILGGFNLIEADTLEEAVRIALAKSEVVHGAAAQGAVPAPMRADALKADLARESADWAKLIKAQKISAQ